MGSMGWEWQGKLDLDWVDWKKVEGFYIQVYGERSIPVSSDHYLRVFKSLGTDRIYIRDHTSALMRMEEGFKIDFNNLSLHINSSDLVLKALVLYRLDCGR